jgi:hypothetical protein
VLSFLLMHYYFDTLMFARPELVLSEFQTLMPRQPVPLAARSGGGTMRLGGPLPPAPLSLLHGRGISVNLYG